MEEKFDSTMKKHQEVKHSVKDSVYRKLFSEPKNCLELYKSLFPDDEDVTIDDIHDVTIRNYMVNDQYNDIAFMVRNELLVLTEAQDTWSDNVVLRIVLYRFEILKREIGYKKKSVFRKKRISIAGAVYFVIYTGDDKSVKDEYRLSELFESPSKIEEDVVVKVIKKGAVKGDILDQYIDFAKRVSAIIKNKGARNITRDDLVVLLEGCIDDGVLSEFLTERMTDVMDTMMSLFTEENMRRGILEDGIEIGTKEGFALGTKQGIALGTKQGEEKERCRLIKSLLASGADINLIAKATGMTIEEIRALK